MVVTERTRTAIWQQMLDMARVTRYYGTLADRYQRRQRLIRSLLLVSAIGGIAPLVTELPETLQHVASVGIGLLVVLDFLFDYAHKAAVLGTISSECGRGDAVHRAGLAVGERLRGELQRQATRRAAGWRDLLHAQGGKGSDREMASALQPHATAQLAELSAARTRSDVVEAGCAPLRRPQQPLVSTELLR